MATSDPHLMRLGHYIEHLEGSEEVARLLSDGIDIDDLENAFLKEPWKAGLTIVRVVDPTGRVKPFIEVNNIKENDHQQCPFSSYTNLRKQGFEESGGEKEKASPKVVGLAMDAGDVMIPMFKPWEKRERGGELKKMLMWNISTGNQFSQKNKAEAAKTSKAKRRGKDKKVPRSTGNVGKAILKILTRTGRAKTSKRDTNIGGPVNTWCGSREIASEQMQARKVKTNTMKKLENNEAKQVSNINISILFLTSLSILL